MIEKNYTKKIICVLFLIIFIAAIFSYWWFFYKKELDSNAENVPIQTEKINLENKIPLLQKLKLNAGFSYDKNNERFFVSTDTPHSLFRGKEAKIFILSKNLKKIKSEITIESKQDFEGIVVIDEKTVKVISDAGELYTISVDSNEMKVIESKNIFNGNKNHKIGSLAFDGKYLYTAEKEGKKIFYKISLDGEILDEFEISNFQSPDLFTIAGMTFVDDNLYILSEAYSTIFKIDLEEKKLSESYSVLEMDECSGLTSDGALFYTVGDYEKYISNQYFYVFEIK